MAGEEEDRESGPRPRLEPTKAEIPQQQTHDQVRRQHRRVEPERIGPIDPVDGRESDHEQWPIGVDAVGATTLATGRLNHVVGEVEGDSRQVTDGGGVDDLVEVVPQELGP
jgi:hypothetical protein